MTDEEKFFAWLDGELSGPEASAIAAKVAADPELARLAEQHRALATHLKSSFDRITEAPVPESLQQSVGAPSGEAVVDLAHVRRKAERRRWQPLSRWAAIAATLVLGIMVGTLVREPATSPVAAQDGKLYAAAALDSALDTQLASVPTDGPVRIGLTFRDRSGAICRTFTGDTGSGLACRDGERWQLRGLFTQPEGQSGEYRMAAGMDPNLAALIDSTIAGEAFDAPTEAAAKQRSWR